MRAARAEVWTPLKAVYDASPLAGGVGKLHGGTLRKKGSFFSAAVAVLVELHREEDKNVSYFTALRVRWVVLSVSSACGVIGAKMGSCCFGGVRV